MSLLERMVSAASGWVSMSEVVETEVGVLTSLLNYVKVMERVLYEVGVCWYEWVPSGDHRSENQLGYLGVRIWLGDDCTRTQLALALEAAEVVSGWDGELTEFEGAFSDWGFIGVRDEHHPNSPRGRELAYPG